MPDVQSISDLIAKHGILIVLVLVLIGFLIWQLIQSRQDAKEVRTLYLADLAAERKSREAIRVSLDRLNERLERLDAKMDHLAVHKREDKP